VCAHVMLIMLLCCALCVSLSRNVTPIGKSGCSQRECDFETPSNCMRCPDRFIDQCCTVGGDMMSHRMSTSLIPNNKDMDSIATATNE
jgi:hypothetical protein